MAKKLSPFEEAFKEARADGKKTFTFNGEKYNTVTADDEQKRIDKMPSVSKQSGPPTTTQGATYPKSKAPAPKEEAPKLKARSLVDQGRDVAIYKNVDKDAVLNAGLGLASLYPGTVAARAAYGAARPVIGAAAKYLSKKDSPASSGTRKDPELFDGAAAKYLSKKDSPASSGTRKDPELFDDAYPREFKKGGSVKLSQAARRGDGIAIRGRTKGKLY